MSISHRERVLAALRHQEPDRIPMDLGSTRNTGILIEPYRALTEFLHLKNAWLPQEDFGLSRILGVATLEECILQKLDIDLRGISLGKPDKNPERILPDGLHQDELGVVRRKPADSYYYDLVYSPFDREMTVADLAKWSWPDPTDPGYVRGLREKALAIRTQTDCALVLHLQDIIVHSSQYLLGFERWYTDFFLDPRLLHALMDILLELRTEQGVRALKEVGDLVDVVSSSDDVAGQQGHVISPDLYRQFIKTRHQHYFDRLRHHTSAKILYHSCGSITALIPDFIDLGIDFINPVQVSAAHMDTGRLKHEFGDQIGFWGAIDTMRVLPFGTTEDVRAEVRRRVRDLASGGGYILAAVHNIQPNVPPQNIIAMFEAGREFGAYPIKDCDAGNLPMRSKPMQE